MICLIHTLLPTAEDATRMAKTLLAERLIACTNILPGVQSLYHWEGQVQHSAEVMLQLKTSPARKNVAMARVAALHPYSVPAIWATEVESLPAFAVWVEGETSR